jgi:hypothetical protein
MDSAWLMAFRSGRSGVVRVIVSASPARVTRLGAHLSAALAVAFPLGGDAFQLGFDPDDRLFALVAVPVGLLGVMADDEPGRSLRRRGGPP